MFDSAIRCETIPAKDAKGIVKAMGIAGTSVAQKLENIFVIRDDHGTTTVSAVASDGAAIAMEWNKARITQTTLFTGGAREKTTLTRATGQMEREWRPWDHTKDAPDKPLATPVEGAEILKKRLAETVGHIEAALAEKDTAPSATGTEQPEPIKIYFATTRSGAFTGMVEEAFQAKLNQSGFPEGMTFHQVRWKLAL